MRVADTNEVAAFLKCHRNTVTKMARMGFLPSFRVGADLRFDLDTVEAWAQAQMEAAQAMILNKPTDVPDGQKKRRRKPIKGDKE